MGGFLTGLNEGMGGSDSSSGSTWKKVAQAIKSRKRGFGGGGGTGASGTGGDSGGQSSAGDDDLPVMHKGGTVRKTGAYRLKRGERVLTKKQQKRMIGKC